MNGLPLASNAIHHPKILLLEMKVNKFLAFFIGVKEPDSDQKVSVNLNTWLFIQAIKVKG